MAVVVSPRLASIQRLRGVAALLVVFVHGFDLVDPLSDPATRAIVDRFWLVDDFGASGVDLFFVLSGFVMALGIDRFVGPGGWRRFLAARARRILPLFWLLCAGFAGRILLGGGAIDWRDGANAVTLLPLVDGREFHLPPIWVGWTLAFECGFYILVALATRTTRPLGTLLVATVCFGVAGVGVHPAWAAARILVNPILLEFAMGVAAFLAWRRGVPAAVAALLMPAGLMLLIGFRVARPDLIFSPEARLVIDGSMSLTRALLWGVPWALVLLGAVAGERPKPAGARRDALVRLGDASYALYLIHAVLMAEAARRQLAAAIDPRLFVLGFVGVSVTAGLAVHRWIEVPLGRLVARQRTSSAFSASTVSPSAVTSAKPPSTRMRADTLFCAE